MPSPPPEPTETPATPTPREGYHHGDLRAALIEQAVAVAREKGPEALTMRALTRHVGVSTNAAYRHFADRAALVQEVTFHAQAAMARAMAAARAALPAQADGAAHLTAVGRTYIEAARAEPGLFRTAFTEPMGLELAADPRAADDAGLTPYLHLGDALDRMVADGSLAAALREGAEAPCWSAVHGFSMLVVAGPLRSAPAEVVDTLAARTVATAVHGITHAP
ncbi:TetR/AcrR family transcriptional regulator [Kytococcus sedentarius]|uniref:TetR/AcrR family transcriptional regulator n=1 Tax=Kytococcus sedentarius TaxID=1276 RepID=UPI0035BBC520